MSKRGDQRRKKQKEQRRTKRHYTDSGYYNGLEYCSNLDDYEYCYLWECYEEEQSWISRILTRLKELFCPLV